VFINLSLNAIEAMRPDGGNLTIRMAPEYEDGNVGIEFRDTGLGISDEELPNIFDPFYSTKEIGTGLGLSICYDIVQQHKGRIDVQSELGIGTVFTVWLPMIDNEDRSEG
jgi:signal transduction histidine kinase